MNASVSVIIPVYNGERYIAEALSSVCEQTVLPVEILVADDASTDRTTLIVEEFAENANVPIKLLRMKKNTGGPYKPASSAFAISKGNYVCILDADDKFAPTAFATYMALFEDSSRGERKIGLATSDYDTFEDRSGKIVLKSYFDQQSAVMREFLSPLAGGHTVLGSEAAKKIYASSFCIPFKGMLSRDAWGSLGGPNLNYKHVCDVEFVWRLISDARYDIAVSNDRLVSVRVSPDSMSNNKIDLGFELVRLMRSILSELRETSLRETMRNRIQKELFDIFYESYKKRRLAPLARSGVGYLSDKIGRKIRGDRSGQ